MLKLAGRVLVNAVIGGVITALMGAACMAAARGIVGAIINHSGKRGGGGGNSAVFACGRLGAIIGLTGGLVGMLIFAVSAARTASLPLFTPLRSLAGRVALGQVVGTLGCATSFLLAAFVISQSQTRPLKLVIFENWLWLCGGAPLLMMCGAGALTKRDSPKTATLNAE